MSYYIHLKENSGNKLPALTFPGAYPIYYVHVDESVLCPSCANNLTGWIKAHSVHWEGNPLTCDNCNDEIDSAYGVPEEETE